MRISDLKPGQRGYGVHHMHFEGERVSDRALEADQKVFSSGRQCYPVVRREDGVYRDRGYEPFWRAEPRKKRAPRGGTMAERLNCSWQSIGSEIELQEKDREYFESMGIRMGGDGSVELPEGWKICARGNECSIFDGDDGLVAKIRKNGEVKYFRDSDKPAGL